jgi:regulator of RNase E activity RraA
MTMTHDDLLAELRTIDTPTITNAVATYPGHQLCLGLYEPWTDRWYTDSSIRCIFPELGPRVGHAVTCVYGLPDPDQPDQFTFLDVIDALDAMPKPTVLVIEQRWPPELRTKAGLAGEIMTTQMQQVGCVGLITDGPSRDVDAIRRLGFQLLLNGVSAGHGPMAVHAVNVDVSVGGMDVKVPADRLADVLSNAKRMLEHEAGQLTRLRTATTAAEVRAAASDGTYSRPS